MSLRRSIDRGMMMTAVVVALVVAYPGISGPPPALAAPTSRRRCVPEANTTHAEWPNPGQAALSQRLLPTHQAVGLHGG